MERYDPLTAAIGELIREWRADAAFHPRETSPGYACGREKCADELEGALQRDARSRASSGPERGDIGAAIRRLVDQLVGRWRGDAEYFGLKHMYVCADACRDHANELETKFAALLDPAQQLIENKEDVSRIPGPSSSEPMSTRKP